MGKCNNCGANDHYEYECPYPRNPNARPPMSNFRGGGQRGRGGGRGGGGGGGRSRSGSRGGGGGQVSGSDQSADRGSGSGSAMSRGHWDSRGRGGGRGRGRGAGPGGDGGDQRAQSDGVNFAMQAERGANEEGNLQAWQTHPYGFRNERLRCQRAEALDRVNRYAEDIVRDALSNADVKEPEHADVKKVVEELGLRTAFSADGGEVEVAANYLPVEVVGKPARLFVYSIDYIVGIDQNGREMLVSNRAVKQSLFDLGVVQTALNGGGGHFVSDLDTIWSTTRRLFDETGANITSVTIRVDASGAALAGHDSSYNRVAIDSIRITETHDLDLNRPVAQLFHNATHKLAGNDDPAVLTRGLNCILTKYAREHPHVSVRTSANKYFWNNAGHPLDRNNVTLVALDGFFASLRPSIDHLLVNVNTVTVPVFVKMTVQDHVNSLLGHRGGTARYSHEERTRLTGIMRGLRVRITFNKPAPNNFPTEASRLKTITGFGDDVRVQKMRPDVSSDPETVHDHYSSGMNVILPLRPDMSPGDISVKIRRNKDRSDFYPASQLNIVQYQSVRSQLSRDQTDEMITVAQKRPAENAYRITNEGLQMFDFNNQSGSGDLNNFHITVGNALVKIPARFLQPPQLAYGGNKREVVENASWNLSSSVFVKTNAITKLLPMIRFRGLSQRNQDSIGDLKRFAGGMVTALKKHGVAGHSLGASLRYFGVYDDRYNDTPAYETQVVADLRIVKTSGYDSAIVILPSIGNQDLYATIKRVGDIRLGLKTICVTENKALEVGKYGYISSTNQQYCSNVAMKCNLKLGGENHYVDGNAFSPLLNSSEACDTIVIGADVAHPLKSASPGCPSIAGVVGSVDDHFVLFPGSMRLQHSRREYIDKLWDMVKERLIDWAKEHKNRLPKRILFYRDGVSESQYEALRDYEIPQINEAYILAGAFLKNDKQKYAQGDRDADDGPSETKKKPAEKDKDAGVAEALKAFDKLKLEQSNPDFQLTYVVVGKRHNTRFYPISPNDTFTTGRNHTVNGNVKPGLLVDQVITHPYSFDFYLQSHQPIVGTGRSAHYVVLKNQMQLSASQLQNVTHAFCYTYAKATRGVSYCAPAYYADRLCDRGRAYLRHWLLNRGEDYRRERASNQDDDSYRGEVMRQIYNSDYWRPHRNRETKYALPRRNPWHPIMDNIMFYL